MSETMLTGGRPQLADGEIAVLAVDQAPPRGARPSVASSSRWLLAQIASLIQWLFGAGVLVVGLAVLAAIPILQFLTLGYLLDASARVAATGRLRSGFFGMRAAARVGGLILGAWLAVLPARAVASYAYAAELIDPGGPVARGWRVALVLITGLTILHLVAACSRGGQLRYFLWPFTNPIRLFRRLAQGGYYAEARDAVWEFVTALRLPYYLWLGVRGFGGSFVWLLVPVSLIAAGRSVPILGFVGAAALAWIVLHLPFLQVRFAQRQRFRALFEVRAIRKDFGRAPWAFAFAIFWTLALALPLYLLKIEMIPREAAWLPSLVFIVFIFPARLLSGWASARAQRRGAPRHWFCRWTGRLVLLPMTAFYVLVVYFAQYAAWEGIGSLYEQHAFLLPVPFTRM